MPQKHLNVLLALLPVAMCAQPEMASAQVYVANAGIGVIGLYDSDSGAAINSSFISGFSNPLALTLSNGLLYVTDGQPGTVGVYDATTGATINSALISGFTSPYGIVVSGGAIYVVDTTLGTVGKYDAVTGATINSSFITGLTTPYGIAVSGNTLFVANAGDSHVATYDATTGATFNSAFISLSGANALTLSDDGSSLYVRNIANPYTIGEYDPATGAAIHAPLVPDSSGGYGISFSNGLLLVTDQNNGDVDVYNATTGALVANGFIAGLDLPTGIVALNVTVPEPSTGTALAMALAIAIAWQRRRLRVSKPAIRR